MIRVRARIRGLLEERARHRAAARRWRAAADLDELGELTACWLAGELASVPSCFGVPAEETAPIAGALAGLNRSGLVTESSQPGMLPAGDGEGRVWRQRAFVIGFVADAATAEHLAALREHGLGVVVIAPGERGRSHVPVTEYAVFGGSSGNCVTRIGAGLTSADLRATYGAAVGAQAYAALCKAWQVAIYDPEWGRDDRLWTAVADALNGTGRGAAR